MLDFNELSRDARVEQGLHLVSGLAYIMETTRQLIKYEFQAPTIYIGFDTGLFYGLGNIDFLDKTMPTDPVNPDCYTAPIEIKDPPPFKGYDCRCRPWYYDAVLNKNEGYLEVTEPFIWFISD